MNQRMIFSAFAAASASRRLILSRPSSRLVAMPDDARPMIMRLSLPLELHVFVGPGERKPGDEPEPRFGDARTMGLHERELPDGQVHGLVVDQLLNAVQER